ncbi:MAG: hypothetical protein HYU37_04435 [Acidobacteria bacterium]|nr:hypothetical protein [Acidobacteriota bacterium]
MPKKAISVTLQAENLTWLKGRAQAAGARSVSDVLDRLVTEARTRGAGGMIRSVVGTIDIDPSDPLLDTADEYIQGLFAESLSRPLLVKEGKGSYKPGKRKHHG